MSDYGDEDYGESKLNVVNGFNDTNRIGYRIGLRSMIEWGKLAKIASMRERFDRESKLIDMIESYFWSVQKVSTGLGDADLVKIVNVFNTLPNKLYKNPYMLVLGYVLIQTNYRYGTKVVKRMIEESRQDVDISLSDVIRYYRLLKSHPLLRS
jgi:hypothetical protein